MVSVLLKRCSLSSTEDCDVMYLLRQNSWNVCNFVTFRKMGLVDYDFLPIGQHSSWHLIAWCPPLLAYISFYFIAFFCLSESAEFWFCIYGTIFALFVLHLWFMKVLFASYSRRNRYKKRRNLPPQVQISTCKIAFSLGKVFYGLQSIVFYRFQYGF